VESDLATAAKFSMGLSLPDTGWRAALRTATLLRARAETLMADCWHLVRYLALELEVRKQMERARIEEALLAAHAAAVIRRCGRST
jgi:hypothetical protein